MITVGWVIVIVGFGALVLDVLLLDKKRYD